jgi:membrane-bound lytic murein transglycosylase A
VRFNDLPDWKSDQHAAALMALRKSCPTLTAKRPDLPFGGSEAFGRVAHWQQICSAAYLVSAGDRAARSFFEEWFVPYMAFDGATEWGLFTGYYEPVLRGSWYRRTPFDVPIYSMPPEAAIGLAHANGHGGMLPNRKQIDAGALSGRGLELLWIEDPVDAFFLHVQGSGQVEMTDGSRVRVGFAGKNGHAYYPIGAELIRRGEIPQEQMSMQAIRAWLVAHPVEAPGLMALNESYVFFRLVDGEGPIGAQGVPLLPGRSMAVDPAFVPYGVPLWLDTTNPIAGGTPLRRLVVAQDAGGAIRGPIRGDLFWGSGDVAEAGAGLMKQRGRWFLLLPKAAAAMS